MSSLDSTRSANDSGAPANVQAAQPEKVVRASSPVARAPAVASTEPSSAVVGARVGDGVLGAGRLGDAEETVQNEILRGREKEEPLGANQKATAQSTGRVMDTSVDQEARGINVARIAFDSESSLSSDHDDRTDDEDYDDRQLPSMDSLRKGKTVRHHVQCCDDVKVKEPKT